MENKRACQTSKDKKLGVSFTSETHAIQFIKQLDRLPLSRCNQGDWNLALKAAGHSFWQVQCQDWAQSLTDAHFDNTINNKLVREYKFCPTAGEIDIWN